MKSSGISAYGGVCLFVFVLYCFCITVHGCCKPQRAMNSFGEYGNPSVVSNGWPTCTAVAPLSCEFLVGRRGWNRKMLETVGFGGADLGGTAGPALMLYTLECSHGVGHGLGVKNKGLSWSPACLQSCLLLYTV